MSCLNLSNPTIWNAAVDWPRRRRDEFFEHLVESGSRSSRVFDLFDRPSFTRHRSDFTQRCSVSSLLFLFYFFSSFLLSLSPSFSISLFLTISVPRRRTSHKACVATSDVGANLTSVRWMVVDFRSHKCLGILPPGKHVQRSGTGSRANSCLKHLFGLTRSNPVSLTCVQRTSLI